MPLVAERESSALNDFPRSHLRSTARTTRSTCSRIFRPHSRIAKLIGKIAMSRDLIGSLKKRYLWRKVFTAAFTHEPASMKFRAMSWS